MREFIFTWSTFKKNTLITTWKFLCSSGQNGYALASGVKDGRLSMKRPIITLINNQETSATLSRTTTIRSAYHTPEPHFTPDQACGKLRVQHLGLGTGD